jgi:GT2 family glycosyltransferase
MTTIDIVIPAHNQRDRLAALLPQLLPLPGVAAITVGDDVSTDGTAEALPHDMRVQVMRLPRRGGPSAARAAAWAQGSAPYVLTLDTDAVIDAATLAGMVAALDTDPALAAVQPVLRCPDGTVHNAGARITPAATTVLLAPPAATASVAVDALCSACALWRRAAVDAAGGWDTRLWYYEDVDLSWRLRRTGHTVAVHPSFTATHAWGGTMGRQRSLRRFYRQEYARRRMLLKLPAAELARRLPRLLWHEVWLLGWSLLRALTDLPATRGASLFYPAAWLAAFLPRPR